jgi:hypothetical protein
MEYYVALSINTPQLHSTAWMNTPKHTAKPKKPDTKDLMYKNY